MKGDGLSMFLMDATQIGVNSFGKHSWSRALVISIFADVFLAKICRKRTNCLMSTFLYISDVNAGYVVALLVSVLRGALHRSRSS